MVGRLVAIHLASLHVIVFCCGSFAATPLVIAELDAKRTIAEADSARANAEQELATWKLTQLKALRSRGHASWQEVVEQEVTAKSATANAQASEQYHRAVLEWQARLAKLNLPQTLTDSESVKLYLPRSARLVAWIPMEVASYELSKRHLTTLRMEYQSLSDIDLSSLEAATKTAERAVEVYGRSEKDADLLSRAELRLRLAKAEYECARTRKEESKIIARRIALISNCLDKTQAQADEPLPALARLGTRFVDATSNGELARLVVAMAIDEITASEQIAWLKLQRDSVSAQIESRQELSRHFGADHGELDHANKQKTELELQIRHAEDVLEVQQQIASHYQQMLKSRPATNIEPAKSVTLDDAWLADANVVRHALELQRLKLQTAAKRAAVKAQHDYLGERLRRVERIPEKARPPKELDHLRHKVQGVEQQLAMVDRDLALLDCEQRRFCHQVKSQRGDQYQLVQAGDGEFIRRDQFEVGAGLIAVVGFVGQGEPFAKMPAMCPYIESMTILDCLSQLGVQALDSTLQIDSRTSFASRHDLRRRGVQSSWKTQRTSNGLRLATDGITYPMDLFCYRPSGLQRVYPDDWWAPQDYLRSASTCGFRSFNPYQSYPFGSCGQSVFSYRVGSPTRSSFPYRSSYLYRTAFPTRSNLYSSPYNSSPYICPTSAYQGFGYSSGLGDNCFD